LVAAHDDVVVTGLGAVSALGEDCDALWAAVEEGRCGIGPIRRFSTVGFSVHSGATVERWSAPAEASRELTESLCRGFGVAAAREAVARAGGGPAFRGPRVALLFGTGIADLEERVHVIAEDIATALGILGPRITVSTACSSSTAAIGFARDLLAEGGVDVVVAGGADVLTPEVFAGFHALGVLTATRCAPFSIPPGTSLGEGAGFLILERRDHAQARGAEVIAGLAGFGLSGDGWHETSPDPKGAGVERAIRGALGDAGLTSEDVGYVNAHGSGTEANDHSEWLGIQRVLGERAGEVPVSSTKGALGHAQGAAGVLEVIVMLLAAERGLIPPTLNFAGARLNGPPDPVGASVPRRQQWDHALAINSAFGGSNAALVFSRAPPSTRQRPRRGDRIAVLGTGVIGADGPGGWEAPDGSGVSEGARAGRVAPFSIRTLVPTADPRGLDPASAYLTGAAALALRHAGVAVRGPLRERTGLLVGLTRGSPSSIVQFQRSIASRGLLHLSPSAFARIVLNAPAGFCSKLLSLRGPLSAVTTGAGSGLTALVLGAILLGRREDVDLLLVGACDERVPEEARTDAPGDATGDEGAVCLLLGNARGRTHPHDRVRAWVAGYGIAGPGLLDQAIAQAARHAGMDGDTIPRFPADPVGGGPATGALLAVEAAVRALGSGEAAHALVTASTAESISLAVLLEAPERIDEPTS
jgi:3-oxoacyl-[acyl-carrier-protein] synthase II